MPEGFDRPANEVDSASSDESTRALHALQSQINQHRETEKSQSYLGTVVDAVWRSDERSLAALETLQQEVVQKAKSGDTAGVAAMKDRIEAQVKQDNEAVSWQSEINHYGGGFLKTAALFARGKIGLAGTIGLYALDQMRPADDMRTQAADMTLGGLKGGLLKGTLNTLGRTQLGVAHKGVALGVSSRALELGLSRQTYLSAGTGEFNLGSGLKNTLLGTLDKKAIVADAAIFTAAHGMMSGANRLTGDAITRSPFWSTTLTGATFGLSAGAGTEIMRQTHTGEDFNLGKVVKRSLLQGAVDGLAATPGGLQASRHAQLERQATSREWQRVFDQLATQHTVVEGKGEGALRFSRPLGESLVIENKPGVKEGPMAAEKSTGKPGQAESTLSDGSRVITKPDGSTVTIRPNGDVVIVKDGVTTTRRKSDGMVIVEKPGQDAVEYRPKSSLRPEEKVLNVASMSVEPIAKLLSNLGHAPFVLDGVRYESVEAFYQTLRISDPARRAEVTMLHGKEAKSAGRDYRDVTTGEYLGEKFELGSTRHHEIVKMALRAKLEQNPDIAQAFMATHPRPIIHNTGRPESRSTKYPGVAFTKALTEIRQELVDKAASTAAPEASPLAPEAIRPGSEANPGDAQPRSISRLLRNLGSRDSGAADMHNLKLYERAFEGFTRLGKKVLGWGSDSVAIELTDGNVLKVTKWPVTPEMGNRPFDVPMVERGTRSIDGLELHYFVQPKTSPVGKAQLLEFHQLLKEHGYYFRESGTDQLGYHAASGKVLLLDPFAVDKIQPR